MEFPDGKRVEIVPALAPISFHDEEVGFFQHSQVLHHSATIKQRKAAADVPRGPGPVLQEVQHETAPGVGEGFEDTVI
jgi:hypothetical protein